MNKKNQYLILFFLIACGAFLRIWNPANMSIWVDEVNTAFAAQSLNDSGKDFLPSGLQYGRSQLFVQMTALSYRIFGFGESGSRLVAGVWGVLSILMVFILSRRFFGTSVALAAVFLMTFSHFEIGWSRVGRMYSLLQFLTLLMCWLFLLGFERKSLTIRFQNPILTFLHTNGFSLRYLLIFGIVFLISFQYVHMLALFLLPGFMLYWLIRYVLSRLEQMAETRFLILFGSATLFGILLIVLIPSIRVLFIQYLSYTPPWALSDGSVLSRTALVEFLISPWRFPLAAFFFLGIVYQVILGKKEAWLPLSQFFVVFVLLSVVFTHRPPRYLFFVYPFFLMFAAYGVKQLLASIFLVIESTWHRHHNKMKICVVFLFTGLFILSPWLRISLKIPFLEDGKTNMAVYPEEWREGSKILQSIAGKDDVILSSLPQVSLFYQVIPDYGLNWANLKQSSDRDLRNSEGQIIDVYAGKPLVTSLAQLDSIMQNQTGHLIVSSYHFQKNQYIPDSVAQFIELNSDPPIHTQQGTVRIYSWNMKEPIHAF